MVLIVAGVVGMLVPTGARLVEAARDSGWASRVRASTSDNEATSASLVALTTEGDPAVAALPPVPPTASTLASTGVTSGVDPPVAAPIEASITALDLGPTATEATIEIRNVSAEPQLWNIDGEAAPFSVVASPGVIEPGQTETITFGLTRDQLAEGTYVVPLTVMGAVPLSVTVEARVEHAPIVAVTRSAPQLVFACDGGSIEVAVSITDESPIASAMVSWIGPGKPGSAPVAQGIEWLGTITPDPVVGTVDVRRPGDR